MPVRRTASKIKHSQGIAISETQTVPLTILTREEAAERLRMTPEQISELIRRRAKRPLPYFKFGKAIRFSASDVDTWAAQQRRQNERAA
jgi:excisionase family DNA binding protein